MQSNCIMIHITVQHDVKFLNYFVVIIGNYRQRATLHALTIDVEKEFERNSFFLGQTIESCDDFIGSRFLSERL